MLFALLLQTLTLKQEFHVDDVFTDMKSWSSLNELCMALPVKSTPDILKVLDFILEVCSFGRDFKFAFIVKALNSSLSEIA